MSVILFLTALFCGYVAGRVSVKHAPPPLTDKEIELNEQLVVAQNLNQSLLSDLQQAKESLRKYKSARN